MAVNNLYMRIRAQRPGWFRRAADMDMDAYDEFCGWVHDNLSWWYGEGNNIVLVGRHGHVAKVHPLFLGPVDVAYLRGVIGDLARCGIHRIEAPMMYRDGHTLRRLLRLLDFHQEGIMRGKMRTSNRQTGVETYLDVELWARLIEGDTNG
jgi:hypothetical protein